MSNPFITDVQIQYNNITIPPEAIEALSQYKGGLINVSELCLRLGEHGMQIVRFNKENVTLCMDLTHAISEVTVSFVVELNHGTAAEYP